MQEKFKKEMEESAKEGNTFAKVVVESWEKEKKQQPEETEGDWWVGLLIGTAGVIAIFVIFGVIILAIIKWAFNMVF